MFQHLGKPFLDDPRLGRLQKIYIKIFGIPISGLRIRLRRILPKLDGNYSCILDAGCGKGIFSFELAKKFPNATVIGIDNDEKQVEINKKIAEKNGFKNLFFEVKDLLQLDYEAKFDMVLSVDNLEHIENDVEVLKRIKKALKPNGIFYCHVPALKRIWVFKSVNQNFDVPGHVRPGYESEELKKKMETAGFSVSKVNETYGYLETVANNLSYLITGADQKNRAVYALTFPWLNLLAWLGRKQDPKGKGAGVFAVGLKKQYE
jgi:cyclopropane fatty-acyl-phospholipid synthase-like methyltransferase